MVTEREEYLPRVDPVTDLRVPFLDFGRGATVTGQKRRTSGLTPAIAQALDRQGVTGVEGARRFGVSRAFWSKQLRATDGFDKKPTDLINEVWPFNVPDRYTYSRPYKNLRLHAVWMLTQHINREKDRTLLRGFYAFLKNAQMCVEYDPTQTEPQWRNKTGGFRYVPLNESDGQLLIRVNQYTRDMSEEMQVLWQMPDEHLWP